jgi:hypothetical protein
VDELELVVRVGVSLVEESEKVTRGFDSAPHWTVLSFFVCTASKAATGEQQQQHYTSLSFSHCSSPFFLHATCYSS